MKKYLLLILLLTIVSDMNAQLATADELMTIKTRLFGNKNWKKIAYSISTNGVLDENRAISYTKIIVTPGRTKEELYNTMRQWIISMFSNPDCDIRVMDLENHRIIAKGSVRNVAESDVLWGDGFLVSLNPIVKLETKDGRTRINITIPAYNVHRHIYSTNSDRDELWNVSSCYPFIPMELDSHSLTSSKALVMSHVCATRYIEIIESAILNYKPKREERDNW